VHRAAIVQLDRVRELREDEAILRDGARIPVSRRRRGALEQLLRRPR
jgi:DNA-binding LytR/AlgR family response regulator